MRKYREPEWEAAFPCPLCGSPTGYEPDCPGYGPPGRVMVCVPPCGGAREYVCQSDTCTWWYRYPNGRSTAGMGTCPDWLATRERDFHPEADESEELELVSTGDEYLVPFWEGDA